MRIVKLPNGTARRVSEDGRIGCTVEIDLLEILGQGEAALLERLSERAVGAPTLSNTTYSVVGNHKNTLIFQVRGSVERVEGVEELALDALPEVEFEAVVTRIGYGVRAFRLSARTEDDAIEIADDDAGNHLYNEHCSQYEIEVRRVE